MGVSGKGARWCGYSFRDPEPAFATKHHATPNIVGVDVLGDPSLKARQYGCTFRDSVFAPKYNISQRYQSANVSFSFHENEGFFIVKYVLKTKTE